ncbi:hypothetical protein [Dysgonomonas capnocytophagoides]|uniref:hypothetical protein n=1 Tax=Dysgonomonas capnocytophagoides TaxID=45254 RepID=UPI00292282CC|nr:hypothetical protein DCPSUM001_33040 [Dysgonomonas capnocytophagoides]
MNEGWIKLYRSLVHKAFYSSDSEKVHLWVHLLLKATHSGREELLGGSPVFCNSGQFTTGRKQLSRETGISESKIERILTYFEKIEQQIEQQKTNTNRLISITKWGDYQEGEQQIEQQLNNDRTTTEQRLNTLQECKESKNVNNDINNSFESFFDEYHKITKLNKSDKAAALKKWKTLTVSERTKALENIYNYYNSLSDKKYCKKARTYLNDKNFNDEFSSPMLFEDNIKPQGKIRQ